MKLGDFLSLKAVVSFVFSLGALLVPVLLVAWHGHQLDDFGVVLARYYGAMLFGVGILCWSVRNTIEKSELRPGILLGLLIADGIGFITALYAQLTVNLGMLGWIDTAIWLILALGLAYFRFVDKGNSAAS